MERYGAVRMNGDGRGESLESQVAPTEEPCRWIVMPEAEQREAAVRLHLGCGQRYLDGYVNIDLPQSAHIVPVRREPDRYADIADLRFEKSTVDEIRLHHVFEHFARPQACALLVAWRSWLKPGGTLRIEVPDFNRTTLAMLNPASGLRGECVGARHLFGSNEAPWAIHLEGWTTRRLSLILRTLGYRVMGVRHNHWRRTYNLEAFAERLNEDLCDDEAKGRVQAFLALFLVDHSPSESAILQVWLGEYERQLARCAAPTTAATGDSSGG